MITKILAGERYNADHGWLRSYHLFSFADYYDPSNMSFGVLRVVNDDYIAGENGFGKHGHKDMEIVTIMLSGTLTHEDSMGNRKEIHQGEVQYMSAGTGVVHSEINLGQEEVHLYQIWFTPKNRGLTPAYDQKDFGEMKKNTLVPVVSGSTSGSDDSTIGSTRDVISFQADATLYLCIFDGGNTTVYEQKKGRGVFVYVTEGLLSINGITFAAGDQARIEDETTLTLTAQDQSQFILIDVGM